MSNYFETTVTYSKILENGVEKKVTEHFLVNGVTFSDAEYRTTSHVSDEIVGEFFIKDIKRRNYSEVIPDESADKWYEVKINFITLDEKTGDEKKTSAMILVQASTSDNAASSAKITLKDSVTDWEIHTIRETKIIDFINSNIEI